MNITKNHIIAIVVILAVYWVYSSWNNDKEHFKAQQWGSHYYYDNEAEKYPVTPSIVSYDIKNYKLPKKSMRLLDNTLPVAHNITTGEDKKTASLENINQVGASLDEIMQLEQDLMGPLSEIRSSARDMENIMMSPQIKEEINSHITHESIIQELHENQPELAKNLPDLEHKFEETDIKKSLMPGMEQKKMIETKLEANSYTVKEEIIPEEKSDYNMSLAILLSVILIGFVCHTK